MCIGKLMLHLLNKCAVDDAASRLAEAADAVDVFVRGQAPGAHKTVPGVRPGQYAALLQPQCVRDIAAKVEFLSLTSNARVTSQGGAARGRLRVDEQRSPLASRGPPGPSGAACFTCFLLSRRLL